MRKRLSALLLALVLTLFTASTALAAVPAAPSPVIASITATMLTVSWPAVTTALTYTVKNGAVVVGSTANLAYTLTGLTPATEYTVHVTAVNADGNSATDGEVIATTLAGGATVSGSVPGSLALGINLADLFTGVSLIGATFWPVIAVMAALGLGFWFLMKTKGIIGGRR